MSCRVRENNVTALIISSVRSHMLRIFNKMSLFKCFLYESSFQNVIVTAVNNGTGNKINRIQLQCEHGIRNKTEHKTSAIYPK